MADVWKTWREWPELILERLEDAGVARVVLNRPERRNSWNAQMAEAFLSAMHDEIRHDNDIKVVVTKGNGPVFSSGLDLYYLREASRMPTDWDRPSATVRLGLAIRDFPRVMIAQVHGYCLGGAFGIMNMHDIVIAAEDTQIGMPEVLRGSFGQFATSTLYHAQIPVKKAALVALLGRNLTGAEADRLGIVSLSFPAADLEARTMEIARELASRHLAPLQNSKVAAQFGRDLTLGQAIQLDNLVGARQRLFIDPTEHVESYLRSQKGGANTNYQRPDA
jgi:enoyl-CoA hydratase/carnithine racemase